VVSINLDDENDRRSPSQKSIDTARNQISSNSSTTSDQIRESLFSSIVDSWLIFEQQPS